jgi:hypothetical protein
MFISIPDAKIERQIGTGPGESQIRAGFDGGCIYLLVRKMAARREIW